jgi:hypothetical protein
MTRARRGAVSGLAVMATATVTMRSPAGAGDSPPPSRKYRVMNSIIAPVSMVLSVMPLIAAVNVCSARSRKQRRRLGECALPPTERHAALASRPVP